MDLRKKRVQSESFASPFRGPSVSDDGGSEMNEEASAGVLQSDAWEVGQGCPSHRAESAGTENGLNMRTRQPPLVLVPLINVTSPAGRLFSIKLRIGRRWIGEAESGDSL